MHCTRAVSNGLVINAVRSDFMYYKSEVIMARVAVLSK